MIYFTSDIHFSHKNLLEKYQPNRRALGANTDEMNEEIIRRWNAVVKPEDEVYNLGDYAFDTNVDKIIEFTRRLNGRKFFLHGNHDQLVKKNKAKFAEHFEWMRDYHEMKVDGEHIVLHHFPLAIWHKMHYGSWHMHGHCHGSYVEPHGNRIVDVGVDSPHVTGEFEMRPFSFEEIRAYMTKRKFTPLDHHDEKR